MVSEPGKIFVIKHVRKSIYDPLVEKSELLHVNPQYAHVKLSNGRETTVLIKDIVPAGEQLLQEKEKANNEEVRTDGVVNESSKCLARQKRIVLNTYVKVRPLIRFGYDEY